MLIADVYIRIQKQIKGFCTPHIKGTRSYLVFAHWVYHGQVMTFVKSLSVIYEMQFCTEVFVILYSNDFSMHYSVWFLQIRSQMYVHIYLFI